MTNFSTFPFLALHATVTIIFCFFTGTAEAKRVNLLANPDFEVSSEHDLNVKIPGWVPSGAVNGVNIDEKKAFGGKKSLSITTTADAKSSGVYQSVKIDGQGAYLRLSAKISSEGLTSGFAGIWLRYQIPGQSKPVFLGNYTDPTDPSGKWASRSVYEYIPAGIQDITVGANITGVGRIWVDDIELVPVDVDEPANAPANVRVFLDEALSKIRENALQSENVKWVEVVRVAHAIAGSATQTEGTYPAINLVLRLLADGHSFLIPKQPAILSASTVVPVMPEIVSKVIGKHLYVDIPAFIGSEENLMVSFSAQLSLKLEERQKEPGCGVILDLRKNGGGNMWPAARALRKTFGVETPGYFVYKDGKRRPWFVADGVHSTPTDADQRLSKLPIALLIGSRTASSGEALVVAFQGRSETRSFGSPTSGVSTGNTPFNLADGAVLVLTTSVLADRTGKTYGRQIIPDESTDGISSQNGADPTIQAAKRWLDQNPVCQVLH